MGTNINELNEGQVAAFETILGRVAAGQTTVVQGHAGCGKTFLAAAVAEALGQDRVVGCAFTGAAAQNLAAKGFANTSTIHRLIYAPILRGGVCVGFRKRSREELDGYALVVVDEFAMVEAALLADLESFGKPLLLLGDPFQLPPLVAVPNKYCGRTDILLSTQMRQAAESDLLRLVEWVRVHKAVPRPIDWNGCPSVGIFRERVPETWLDSSRAVGRPDMLVLCGRNKTREALNAKAYGRVVPMVGDRISMLKNVAAANIFNGQDLVITHLENRPGLGFWLVNGFDYHTREPYSGLRVRFSAPPPIGTYAPRGLCYATFAFAKTVHKAQGQTIGSVVVCLENEIMGTDPTLRARWLYTALSRASHKAVLLTGGQYV